MNYSTIDKESAYKGRKTAFKGHMQKKSFPDLVVKLFYYLCRYGKQFA